MSQFYRCVPFAARAHILHVDLRSDPDRAKLEPLAALLLVEEFQQAYDGASPERTFLLPVPMSLCSNSFSDLSDLVPTVTEGRYWELRSEDVEAAQARLGYLYPCSRFCRWNTLQDNSFPNTTEFVHEHNDCPATPSTEDCQLALEAAP